METASLAVTSVQGQGQGKDRPTLCRVGGGQIAAMGAGKLPCNRQPQPAATFRTGTRTVGTVETLEDVGQRLSNALRCLGSGNAVSFF
jgi:hypothetical protein